VINFLLKERHKATAIHQRLVAVYGDSASNNYSNKVVQWIHTWPSVSGRWLPVWLAFECSESDINRCSRKTDYVKSKS